MRLHARSVDFEDILTLSLLGIGTATVADLSDPTSVTWAIYPRNFKVLAHVHVQAPYIGRRLRKYLALAACAKKEGRPPTSYLS